MDLEAIENDVVKLFGRKKGKRGRLKGKSVLTYKRYWLQRTKQKYSVQDLMDDPSILDELQRQNAKLRMTLSEDYKTLINLEKLLKSLKKDK